MGEDPVTILGVEAGEFMLHMVDIYSFLHYLDIHPTKEDCEQIAQEELDFIVELGGTV